MFGAFITWLRACGIFWFQVAALSAGDEKHGVSATQQQLAALASRPDRLPLYQHCQHNNGIALHTRHQHHRLMSLQVTQLLEIHV